MAQAETSPHQSKLKGLHAIFPRPEVTDRSAFAPGIEISPALDLLILSGISAYPPEVDPWNPGSFRISQDPAERSKMATANLDRILKAAGSTWEHIVFNVNYTAPGGGGINFAAQYGDWRPCSTSLRVKDTGVPGVNVLYQVTATAPHKPITARGPVADIEAVLDRPGIALKELPQAPAIRVTSAADLVYFPAVTAYPPDVNPWNSGAYKLPDDLAAQERMVTDNIDRMLKAARLGWQNIVLMARTGEVKGVAAMQERFGDWRPCRTTRAVRTGIPGARIVCEITAVARR
jgi:enamine deaminase RidA (YjgF/YER057c/UK114 family)